MNTADNPQKSSRLFKIQVILVTLSVIALFSGIVGLYNIYINNKTDRFNHGQITVNSCEVKDRAWKVYSCTGDYFSTGGGMVGRNDVTVKVFGIEPQEGQIIDDVYPPNSHTAETTDHFVTGRERASVIYNIPWLMLVLAGIVIPLLTTVFIVMSRHTDNTRSASQ